MSSPENAVIAAAVIAAVVVAAPRARPSHNFKWDDESDLLFLKAVYANKAYIRSLETFEVKWIRVILDLTKREKFSSQGFNGKAGSLTTKLRTMLTVFKASISTRNLSALPDRDDLDDIKGLLLSMEEAIEKLGEDVELEKNTKKQKKRSIGHITDALYKGGANVKENLYNLASDLRASDEVLLSASVSNFAKMGAPVAVTPATTVKTCPSQQPRRRRLAESAESDDAALMTMFSIQIKKDKESAQDKFVVLEKQIKESGSETTSAILSSNVALIAAISALSMNLLRH